jgi:hypothetical protein
MNPELSKKRISTIVAALQFYKEEEMIDENDQLLSLRETNELISELEAGTLKIVPAPSTTTTDLAKIEEKLKADRETAAIEKFETTEFGFTVTDQQSGWERDGKFWSKKVYGEDPDSAENVSISFGIEFREDTAEVVDSWCENLKG